MSRIQIKVTNKLNILCNISRFEKTSEANQYQLIHHEYAGLVKLEANDGGSSDYQLSEQITDYLRPTSILRLSIIKQTVQSSAGFTAQYLIDSYDGVTKVLYEHNNWVYFRFCKDRYQILDKLEDCVSEKEVQLLPLSEFKQKMEAYAIKRYNAIELKNQSEKVKITTNLADELARETKSLQRLIKYIETFGETPELLTLKNKSALKVSNLSKIDEILKSFFKKDPVLSIRLALYDSNQTAGVLFLPAWGVANVVVQKRNIYKGVAYNCEYEFTTATTGFTAISGSAVKVEHLFGSVEYIGLYTNSNYSDVLFKACGIVSKFNYKILD